MLVEPDNSRSSPKIGQICSSIENQFEDFGILNMIVDEGGGLIFHYLEGRNYLVLNQDRRHEDSFLFSYHSIMELCASRLHKYPLE